MLHLLYNKRSEKGANCIIEILKKPTLERLKKKRCFDEIRREESKGKNRLIKKAGNILEFKIFLNFSRTSMNRKNVL